MKKLFLLMVALCTGYTLMAYTVTVFGYVKRPDATPVKQHPVQVSLVKDNAVLQSMTALTQDNGKYIAVFQVDDNLTELVAYISLKDCQDETLEKEVSVSKLHPVADAHFTWCATACAFDVVIEQTQTNSGEVILVAVPLGGLPPYQFHWSNGQTGQTLLAQPGDKYCVVVTDQDGCQGESCLTPGGQEDCFVEIEALPTNNPASGTKLIAKPKGEGPFTYLWSNGSHEPYIYALQAGKYCVTIMDNLGCQATSCMEVGANDPCAVEIHATLLSSGARQLEAHAKGTPPFAYHWSNGSGDKTIIIEKPGIYCVEVVDANGCQAKACYEWKQDGKDCAVEISVVYDGNKAKLIAHPKGKAPYTFHWSNGANGPFIHVEKPGEYCVVIVDANGCEAKACVVVKEPNTNDCQVHIQVVPTQDPAIFKLIAQPKGPGPFHFLWNNGATVPVIYVESPGEYCVIVQNDQGCEAKACIKLHNGPPAPCAVEIVKSPSNSGLLILKELANGKAPFSYMWNTGETTASIAVEKPGEYCVKVTDADGCVAEACIHVGGGSDPNGPPCAVHIKVKYKSKEEALYLFAVGKGKPPFAYAWSNGHTGPDLLVKEPGVYCVTITDAQGCQATACIEIEKDEFTGGSEEEGALEIRQTYPVPAGEEVFLRIFNPSDARITFQIFDLHGMVIDAPFLQNLPAGEHLIHLPLNGVAPGTYWVRISSDKETVTTPLIRSR